MRLHVVGGHNRVGGTCSLHLHGVSLFLKRWRNAAEFSEII
jgi:hypothetical protein